MRVAYVCADPGLPVFGRKGGSVHAQEVLRALRRRGLDVELFATRVGGEAPAGLENLPVHSLAVIEGSPAAREIAGQGANGVTEERLDAAGRFDLVYERYSLWGRAGMAWSRRRGVPGVLEVNAPLIDEQATHRGLVDRDAAEACARAAFTNATAVIAVSEAVAGWVRARAGATPVHVVANGVDPRRITPRSRPRSSDTFTLGFVGTLKPWHGLDTLLAAVAILVAADPSYRLRIVGDGPGAADLAAGVAERGLGPVTTLAGAVDPVDVPAELHRMDVAVAPYPDLADFYFSPLKLYEYLAAGLAVVASRVGQVIEVLDDGRIGELCPPGDPVALAAAVARLRADPARRAALGRAGRHEVVLRHTWDHRVGDILALAEAGAVGVEAVA